MTGSPLNLAQQVVRISRATSISNPPRFGTGFVIHRDLQYAYIVTCYHVVEDLCPNHDERDLLVDNIPAQVRYWDDRDGFDLAILCVDGTRLSKATLRPKRIEHSSVQFETAGYRRDGGGNIIEPVRGVLSKEINLVSNRFTHRPRAWYVTMHDEDRLEVGNSGSPVIDATGCVIGVVRYSGPLCQDQKSTKIRTQVT